MAPSTRRSVLRLAGLGVVSAVAGCSSSDDEASSETVASPRASDASGSTATPNRSATVETLAMGATATSDRSVTVSDPRLRTVVVAHGDDSDVHTRPVGTVGSQFLSVVVSTDEGDLARISLDAVLDGEPQGSALYRDSIQPGNSGRVHLQIPVRQAQQGAVEWRAGDGERFRWTLPSSVVSRVGLAPSFEVTAFDVPAELSRGEQFTGSVTVSNTGERAGTFRAMVLNQGASSLPLAGSVTVPVDVGETVTHDISGATLMSSQSTVTAVLDWGLGERRATFSVTE